jgi:multicomponent Na+:H+ antiporter subunit B
MVFSNVLKTICRLILPFLILFGVYIIVNGDLSVGGGFQGGVILSTSYLLYYFVTGDHPFPLSKMLKIDKFIFVLLPIVILLGYITRGYLFTNFFHFSRSYEVRRLYLLALNLLIGAKVAIGFVSLFFVFIEEGNS